MKILNFPERRQTYSYDCGATAIEAVLNYYGINVRENMVMKIAKTDKTGTTIKHIIKVAEQFKLKADSRQMTIPELKSYIDKKIPIIVPMQAWTTKKIPDRKNIRKSGHYVVVIGYDSKKLYFEDPAVCYRTYLTYKEFLERWHDEDYRHKRYEQHGIAVYSKKPLYSLTKMIHME